MIDANMIPDEVVERLNVENIQMKFALGYPMPADLERYIIPSNPFRCGTCDARNINRLAAENERLRAALEEIIQDSFSVYAIQVARAALQEPRT